MRLASLLLLTCALGFAESWTGYLVDAGCYANEQTNVSKDPTTVDRDMNLEIRQCSPKAKPRNFAVVLGDWKTLQFDSAGNAKAEALISGTKSKPTTVTVTGKRTKDTIQVDSLAGQ